MIGDEYFQLRAQLGTALYSLSTLAHDLQAPPETLEALQGLNNSLREPFLFVVMGEVKAGKSSVLNALFGREFCRVDVLPATDRIYIFKHGQEERDVPVNDHVTECYRPCNFLRDFNVVDTPGTNTIVARHQEITEHFLPMADVVLFVFSITNPWAASAWEFLNLIHKKWLKNVVFILQQVDLRSDTEVNAVMEHLRQTAREKLGVSPPIFPVSAKTALHAKTDATDKAGLLAESRFGQLEAYISEAVARGEQRLGKLRSVCGSAQVVVQELSEKVRGAFESIRKDNERIQQFGAALEDRQEQSLRQVGGMLWSLAQSYERIQNRAEEMLLTKLSWSQTFKLIFRKPRWQSGFQENIALEMQEALKRQIENSVELLEGDLRAVWQQLHEKLQRNFASEAPPPPSPRSFLDEREELLKRMEETLVARMASHQFEREMTKLFDEAASWMRVPAGVAAVGGAATIAAALAKLAVADVTGTVAVVAALFGAVVAVSKRNKIITEFRSHFARNREGVLAPIEDQLRHAIALFYQDLGETFQPLQTFCAAQRRIYEPVLARLKQLDESLSSVGEKIGLVRKG